MRLPRVTVAAMASLVACGRGPADTGAPEPPPEGLLVCGQAEAGLTLLAQLEALEGSPIAEGAAALRTPLARCQRFSYGPSQTFTDLDPTLLSCEPPAERCAPLATTLGRHAVAFAWSPPGGPTTSGWLDAEPEGSLRAEARVPKRAGEGSESPLLPAADPPGPAVLSSQDAVFQARLRPQGGLALGGASQNGPDVKRLMQLQGRIFQAGVLDGTLELAIYAPAPGMEMPPIAIAVGYHLRAAAVAAMREAVENLEAQWKLHATPTSVQGHEGQCLLQLKVLPDFAPCWVVGDQAVILGWNDQALERALAGPPPPELAARNSMIIDFAGLAEAERSMALARGFTEDDAKARYPWHRLTLEAWQAPRAYRYRLDLDAGGAP